MIVREVLRQIGNVFTWFILIAPWEQGLRVRFGRHVRLLRAGMHIRIPFCDRVYRQSVRRRLNVVAPQTLTTRDGVAISIAASIGYRVDDIRKLYDSLHDAADTIEAEVAAIVARFVSSVLSTQCTPGAVEEHVRAHLALDQYGLAGQEFYITCFARVKTYRFITGEFRQWQQGQALNTWQHEHQGDKP